MTARDLVAREAEILVLMHGTDETFATRVSSRRSYRSEKVVWDARFRNILNTTRAGGGVSVDLTQIDLYDAVDLPLPAAPHERP
ncbi:hypothetical protein [Gemmatimonas sp.]|uniref:hypothetical protein n=1 Tax=Gemmatimonas sp. TaxID=1962908 RepID=UPI00286CDB1B|nr:hypothetical protein [Gemmatimonas sp.]